MGGQSSPPTPEIADRSHRSHRQGCRHRPRRTRLGLRWRFWADAARHGFRRRPAKDHPGPARSRLQPRRHQKDSRRQPAARLPPGRNRQPRNAGPIALDASRSQRRRASLSYNATLLLNHKLHAAYVQGAFMRNLLLVFTLFSMAALAASAQSATPAAPAKPPVHHAAAGATTAIINTTVGKMTCTLFPDKAPIGVANF